MKAHPIQTNFTAGEISPRMYGRVDTKKFTNGALKISNAIVCPQGGVYGRTGTDKVVKTKYPDKKSYLIDFVASDESAYMLEFGHYYLRMYKNRQPLYETTTTEVEEFITYNSGGSMGLNQSVVAPPTKLPNWSTPTSITSSGGFAKLWFDLSNYPPLRVGDYVYMVFGGYPAGNGQYTITAIDPAGFYAITLSATYNAAMTTAGTTLYSHGLLPGDKFYVSGAPNYPTLSEKFHLTEALASGGEYLAWLVANIPYVNNGTPTGEEVHSIPIELWTPYSETELEHVCVTQSADVMYIAHPRFPTRKLSRLDTDGDRNDWKLTVVDFFDGPYLRQNDLAPAVNTTNPEKGTIHPDVYFEVSQYSHTATVKCSGAFAAGTPSADQNNYIEYREHERWRLARVTSAAGGATTGSIEIYDNVVLFMDETTKLKSKSSPNTYTPGSTGGSSSYGVKRGPRGNGWDYVTAQQKLDSRNAVSAAGTAAGTLTAQYSNTFGQSDLGRYIRYFTTGATPVQQWALIDQVPGTTGTTVHHGGALTKTSNFLTGAFVISNEVRSGQIKSYQNGVAFNVFASTDVGRHIRLGFSGKWVFAKITQYISASQVIVTFYDDFPRDPQNAALLAGNRNPSIPDSGVTYDWRLGAWSETTGYPAVATFHEQRLVFGRTTVEPQTMWYSVIGSYEDMSPTEPDSTVTDSSAITQTLVSEKVNNIRWLKSKAVMLVGGFSQEWQVKASSSIQEPITATNADSKPQTDYGSKLNCRALSIGAATIFADKRGRKLRELTYNFELDSHVAQDISIIAEHFLRNARIVQLARVKDPVSIIWLLLSDGTLAGVTYEKEHEVVAWHRHQIGGSGFVESIATIPSANGPDELYMVVRRTINGATSRFIEVLYSDFIGSQESDKTLMPFLDAAENIVVTDAISTVEGLHHFIGESLRVLADGNDLGTKTVSAQGTITLGVSANNIRLGYSYTPLIGILPIEAGAILGTAQIKTKRVNKLGIRVEATRSVETCSTENGSYQNTSFGSFYTGDKVLNLEQGYNLTGGFYLRQSKPEPFNIILVAPELATYEES